MTRLRQLWLLTALGSLAALMGGYFLLVSPQNSKAAALRTETEEQEARNAQLQSQINMLNKQKKSLPEQQALLSRFAGLIPGNPAMPRFVRALSDAADAAGVELVSISPKNPEWAKAVNTQTGAELAGKVDAPKGQVLVGIPVELKVAGQYSQLTQFFTEIEEMNRALLVADFSVKRVEKLPRQAATGGTAAADTSIDVKVLDQLEATISTRVWMTKKAPAAPAAPTTTASDADVTK